MTSTPDDSVLTNLLAYAKLRRISHNPSIDFRRLPGRGLGVYASKSIDPGDTIMHVPASALLTPATVPLRFASKLQRKEIPVHALLASYVAFGLSDKERERLSPWMDSWPTLTDFTSGMPMFWPDTTRRSVVVNPEGNGIFKDEDKTKKQGKNRSKDHVGFMPLPPDLVGPPAAHATHSSPASPGLLVRQLDKFAQHIAVAAAAALPGVPPAISDPTKPAHWAFCHAWACVNTRCFYYVPPGAKAPADSNEAMAMLPLMDLFNHSCEPNCQAKYDRTGFTAKAMREIGAGEELLLSYGAHTNDDLFSEYGFVMPGNDADAVRLDDMVLAGLADSDKAVLEQSGYLGLYTLKRGGVCFRTEAVSYLGVLSPNQWHAFVSGSFDPEKGSDVGHERQTKSAKRQKRSVDSDSDSPFVRAKRKRVAWCQQLADYASNVIEGLAKLTEEGQEVRLLEIFADSRDVLMAQGCAEAEVVARQKALATSRSNLCKERAEQILDMCESAMQAVRDVRGTG